ncbi:cytochrome P450 [Flavobacterium poyangense]|uniref:cytochrome P450 n=1 Tax=Flavobacterium poyangense TaxID=2204302 RepID=UPI0014205437|nr:cytochrome P450 [Flavobacterium sp. JXAS1]
MEIKKEFSPIRLVNVSELKDKNMIGVNKENVELVVVNYHDQIKIFQGLCPHEKELLSFGEIGGEQNIICPAHQWQFDCISGKNKCSSKDGLRMFYYEIVNGDIFIDKNELLEHKMEIENVTGQRQIRIKTLKDLPGPKTKPFFGNSLSFLSKMDKVHLQYEEWAKQYGSFYKINVNGEDGVVISEVSIIKEILNQRPYKYRRFKNIRPVLEGMEIHNLFSTEGDEWKRSRKYVTQALSNKVLRSFYPSIQDTTKDLYNHWENVLNKNSEIDLHEDIFNYSFDIISHLAFGQKIGTVGTEESKIQNNYKRVMNMIQFRIVIPVQYWKFFKLPKDHKLDKDLKEIKQDIWRYIDEAKERVKLNPELKENPTNYIEALLQATDDDGVYLTDDEIYPSIFGTLVAGEDTTANTILWVLHYITDYPEVQKKMREEIVTVLGEEKFLQTMDDSNQLDYVNAVIYEVMRLKPVIPVIALTTNEDCIIGEYEIPKDTDVFVLSHYRDQESCPFLKREAFDPERWVESKSVTFHTNQSNLIPFGLGKRICPGKSLAMVEMKTILCMILKNYEISKSDKENKVEDHFNTTLGPSKFNIKLERLNVTVAAV